MGEILLAGLLRAGWDASEVVGAEPPRNAAAELASRYGVRMEATVDAAASGPTSVLLAVKPYDVPKAAAPDRPPWLPGAL
jgi:pyrroline-5-carboxylate reductase